MITEKKEADEFLKALWELNDKYPDYVGHVRFDGASHPYHDIDECKKTFKVKLHNCIEKNLKFLNDSIEEADESGNDKLRKSLIKSRKSVKEFRNLDIDASQNIEELLNLIPEELKEYW